MSLFIQRENNILNWDKELEQYQGSLFLTTPWIAAITGDSDDRKPVYLRFFRNGEQQVMLASIEAPINWTFFNN